MALQRYIALLRGINVGGNNIIKMAALKECFEAMGFSKVQTYIQSGNVIFETEVKNVDALETKIEKVLSRKFKYQSRVVVVPYLKLKEAVKNAPEGFGSKPNIYRYDVIFLKPPLTSAQAIKYVSIKEGVDQASAGKNVLYFWRLIAKATQSHLPKIIQQPVYKSMTIRNWNTTTKLLKLIN